MIDLINPFFQVPIYDLSSFYSEFVPFTANSAYPIHRWYRFKEGFSRDLVHLVIGSLKNRPDECLDLFAGSGTTPLACQEVGIKCHSIEVNPFLYHVAKTKLYANYTLKGFDEATQMLRGEVEKKKGIIFEEPIMSTLTQRHNIKKWLFHKPVLQEILSIRDSIASVDTPYGDLLLVSLASILTETGNTIKDGKCVRYKAGWADNLLSRDKVRELFFKALDIYRQDVAYIANFDWKLRENAQLCQKGDALEKVKLLQSNSMDLVVTSPPYLNSFDYTDIYMPELWALGFVKTYDDVRNLRSHTLRSHVQVKWDTDLSALNDELRTIIDKISENNKMLWNTRIPEMIGGYFMDIQSIFWELKRLLKPKATLCVIVATSSYYNVYIPTDFLFAKIAIELGFKFKEMRVIRKLKRSSRQILDSDGSLPSIRESMLFFEA